MMVNIMLRNLPKFLLLLLILVIAGFCIPERLVNPVKGATSRDWNHQTFWYSPWGASGVHKGIDIFGKRYQQVIAPVSGIVIFSGELKRGGHAVAILGPKWRVHYMAHLQYRDAKIGEWVSAGDDVGGLGDTGNARGKQPHVHYSIMTLVPYLWRIDFSAQGYKKAFYLSPHDKLIANKKNT